MSESELDSILNEIKNRGKANNAELVKNTDEEVFSIIEESNDKAGKVEEEIVVEEKAEIVEPVEEQVEALVEESIEEDEYVSAQELTESVKGESELADITEEYAEIPVGDEPAKKSKKGLIITIVAIVVAVAVGVGVYFMFFANKDKEPQEPTKPTIVVTNSSGEAVEIEVDGTKNPLTGEVGFNKNAVGKRPIAVVVENEFSSAGVRPQWGIDKADIVLEGESEFSTRTLLFWSDYNSVPSQVGPTRSARPPFIRFSQLFDSIFIHAGLSHSAGNYEGADDVFINEGIDHVNLLDYATDGVYMGRDKSRTSVIEHTGYLNGENVAKLLQEKGFETTINPNKYSILNFYDEPTDIGKEDGTYAYFKWSATCPDSIEVNYDKSAKVYTTTHFDSSNTGEVSNCKWTNCIFLFDTTEYVVKENYKGSGRSETYCDYYLDGGEGYVLSNGKSVKIKWGVEDSKLWMKNAETDEEILLNPGKSYIGYGSSNQGGELYLSPMN